MKMYTIFFESTGVFGQDALNFFCELSRRSCFLTMIPSGTYVKLCQHNISVCKQNYNGVSIKGSCIV